MDFLGFLQAIGAATRLDISAAVQDGGCSIVFSDSLEVTFEHDEQNQKVVLFAPVMSIGEWPAESREHMLSRVLEVHLFGMATDGNYFGFDPLLERILFFRSMALPQLEAAPAIQAVESFVDQLEHWQGQLLQSSLHADAAAQVPAPHASGLPIQPV
ncbi:MAG: type III secretion system chaperone [Comamonas sp.]